MGPQEDYIETVFTCEGDYDDPHLQDRLEDFKKSLKDLLLTDKSKLILKKVEPWNSVRVTFNIPREAAVRLKQLAQQGNTQLKDLGVLAVQIQDQHISLTIAGRNNEHAQLVFRTAETSMANMPVVSVVETSSSSFEGRGPQTPWPNYVETTSKNIADYLRQGLDSLLHPSGDKNFQQGVAGNGHRDKRNNIIPTSVELSSGKYKPFQQLALPTSHHGNPTRSSPSVNATSPRRSPVGQTGLEFPQLPGMPPGLPPGLPPGPRHLLDNLPPPPPYPQGSSIVNNLQKLRFATDTNPLLVNLLHQHDPNLSSLLQAGLLPPGLDADAIQQPQKKKRKPRKPKEKKKNTEMEIPVTTSKVGYNPVASIPAPTTLPYSSVTVQSPLISTSLPNQDVVSSAKENTVQNYSRALHNIPVQNKPEPISLSGPGGGRKAEESDTAGKIINPVTGLLEPMDCLSDTSPTKSESGKNSPRSLAQKIYNTSEVVSTSQSKTDSMLSFQGRHAGLHPSIQRTLSEHSIAMCPEALSAPIKALTSSQSSVSVSSDLLHHKQFPENFNADLVARSEVKNDIIPPYSKLEQKFCDGLVGQQRNLESKCDKFSAPNVGTAKVESGTVVGLPQESYIKSIPPQLLNKPLLQVKHTNSTGGKPSGSPESNGDSECSSQSIILDTQNGADLASQASQPLDPRSYNNDSGVGSSSERSDDTPSEPGDSDFKSGSASSFECAKNPIIDPLKQTPPTSKVVTIGFAINDSQKNHKVVSPFMSSEKIVNSKLDLTKMKSDKTDLCSPSQLHGLPWTSDDDQIRRTNIVDSYVKQVVQESINRKSPKSSVGLNARIPGTDGQINSMQGIHEQTMQKKKSSPRNSPRGSPRNPSSPRNANSPRGGGSPRSTDAVMSGNSRQPFLTAQEFATHLPYRESHNKSPYSDPGKSPHGDPRKSPFNFLLTPHTSSAPGSKTNAGITHLITGDLRHDLQSSVGLDALRLSHQCNIDNLTLLKSLEAAHGSIAGKEASILQKFQKLQQQAAQAATVPVRNGTEVLNHLSRSPGPVGPLNKHCPPPSIDDVHNAFDIPIQNNLHPSVTVSTSNDRENTLANCVNSKGNKEELKGANNSSGSRRSPGAATSTCNSASSYPNDSSLLPPPKRLTESVQKLFPNPLDNTLPHNIMNRRSPISSASVTRINTTTNGSVSIANSRGSLPSVSVKSSGNKTPVSELDLDSIIPSISGFGFGPTDLQIDTSLKSQIGMSWPDSVTMPKLLMMDSTNSSHQNIVSTSAVKVVPAVTGSITSHKAYVGDVPKSSSMHLSHLVSSKSSYSISSSGCVTNVSNTNSDTNMSMCNSDSKMASVRVSTADCIFKSHGVSSTFGPPILHPQTVKYPKIIEMPTSPYQQMGLSEMLQETANLQSIATTQASSTVSNISVSSRVSQHVTVSDQDKKIVSTSSFVERIQVAVGSQRDEQNSLSETKHSSDVSLCDSQDSLQANVQIENSDIPKLKCQVDIANRDGSLQISSSHMSKNLKNEAEENLQNLSDLTETSGLFTNKDPSPPILTAVTNVSVSDKENISKEPDKFASHLDDERHKNPLSSSSATIVPKVHDSRTLLSDVGSHISVSDTQLSNLSIVNDQDGHLVECSNSFGDECENPNFNLRASKLRKRRGSSESIEEKSEEPDVAPRQLRSRKRTNTGENENSSDDSKRLKLDLNSEVISGNKVESVKEAKAPHSVKTIHSSVSSTLETKSGDETNTQESQNVKSGVRTRTNLKNVVEEKDKGKPPTGRESRKDGKVISNKAIPDKKTELSKVEDVKRIQQNRRNRQSPSAPTDKLVTHTATREKSPLRMSRSRGHSSPVVMEGSEEAQENKRTTRSARSKVEPVAQASTKNMLVNKRRRTSQDHR